MKTSLLWNSSLCRILRITSVAVAPWLFASLADAETNVRVRVIAECEASSVQGEICVTVADRVLRMTIPVGTTMLYPKVIGEIYVPEGGAGYIASVSQTNLQFATIRFVVAERQSEFSCFVEGRRGNTIYVSPHTGDVSKPVAVFNNARRRSQVGESGVMLVGQCTSPFLKTVRGEWNEDMELQMEISLGSSWNGQPLPPLCVNYGVGVPTVPTHKDIVPGQGGYGFTKYHFPQGVLRIEFGQNSLGEATTTYKFAPPEDEDAPFVTYTYTRKRGADETKLRPVWTRKFVDGASTLIESSEAMQDGLIYSAPVTVEVADWHEGEVFPRVIQFARVKSPTVADEVTIKDAVGVGANIASFSRIEYQTRTEEYENPEDPGVVSTVTSLEPKTVTRGTTPGSVLTTEYLLTSDGAMRGKEGPDGLVETWYQGYDGLKYWSAQSWLNASPEMVVPAYDATLPSGVLKTNYTYAADWSGSVVLPAKQTSIVDGKTVREDSYSYTNNVNVSVYNNNQQIQIATLTRRTMPSSVSGGAVLVSVKKTFQPNTASYFLADLPYSEQTEQGQKTCYVYQRGTIDESGGFEAVEEPDALGAVACNAVKTITIIGVAATDTNSVSTAVEFGGITFDEVGLVSGRSVAKVELRVNGVPVRTEKWIYKDSAFTQVAWQTMTYASGGRLVTRLSSDGTTYSAQWSGLRKANETDETGVLTTYGYDAAGRVDTLERGEITFGTITVPALHKYKQYDAANRVVLAATGRKSATEQLVSQFKYDTAGLLQSQSDPDGTTLKYVYTNGGRTTSTTTNLGTDVEATKVVDRYVDGRVRSITGDAVVPEFHHYGWESRMIGETECSLPVTTVYSGEEKTETVTPKRYQIVVNDLLGRVLEERSPGPGGVAKPIVHTTAYAQGTERIGLETRSRTYEKQPDDTLKAISAESIISYDAFGEMQVSGLDMDGDGKLTGNTTDRVTTVAAGSAYRSENWWSYSVQSVYETDNATDTTTGRSEIRLTGLGSGGLISQALNYDAAGAATTVSSYISTADKTLTTVTQTPDGAKAKKTYIAGLLVLEQSFASGSATESGKTSYQYDNLGRLEKVVDSRDIETTTVYYDKTTLPWKVGSRKDSSGGLLPDAVYTYCANRVKSVVDAAGKSQNYEYNERGQVLNEWGTAANPVHHEYHSLYGHETERWTYRKVTLGTKPTANDQPDKTLWSYDDATGLLTYKRDAAENDTDFSYSFDFVHQVKIVTRTSARPGAALAKHYDLRTGDLKQVTGTNMADVGYKYTRAGRVREVTDATGTRTFTYEHGKPLGEFLPGFFGNLVRTSMYQDETNVSSGTVAGRYEGTTLGVASSGDDPADGDASVLKVQYGYDSLGRIEDIVASYPGYSASLSYTYTGATAHWEKLTHNGYSLSRTLESGRNLIGNVTASYTSTGGSTEELVSFEYGNDDRGLRGTMKQNGRAFGDYGEAVFTKYDYDGAGQIQTARGYMGGDVSDVDRPLQGRSLQFQYDSAGNRTKAAVDANEVSYTDGATPGSSGGNALNQVKQRGNLKQHASGTAPAGVTVGVNGQQASRQGRYWDAELALWSTFTRLSVQAGSESGEAILLARPAAETFNYDLDGNLKDDGLWTYTYDADDRLVQMNTSAVAVTFGMPNQTIRFTYDYLGRRVRKQFSGYSSSYGNRPATDTVYIWDGWLLLAEADVTATNAATGAPTAVSITASYVWGLDISGSLTASGGVGGLALSVKHNGNTLTARDIAYDGAGNVAALVDANGGLTAVYEYDAFGQLLRQTGGEALTNPFRFSTRYCDRETGLYYYGYRYYDASLGRFINRDPIGEQGGNNLYGFCGNNPVNGCDVLGMDEMSDLYSDFNDSDGYTYADYVRQNYGWLVDLLAFTDRMVATGEALRAEYGDSDAPNNAPPADAPVRTATSSGSGGSGTGSGRIEKIDAGRYYILTDGKHVNIVVKMQYAGAAATPDVIAKFNAGIAKYWTGQSGKYEVRMFVQTVSDGSGFYPVVETRLDGGAVANGRGSWDPRVGGWDAAHEVAHWLTGDGDHYGRAPDYTPDRGYENSIMGGRGLSPNEADIDRVLNLARYNAAHPVQYTYGP